MNLGKAKQKASKLLDIYSKKGVVISATDPKQADSYAKMNDYADQCQKEVATTTKKIPSRFKFSQYPVANSLANPTTMFDIYEHIGSDITYSTVGAKAYYFEVDNVADIYIEEYVLGAWVTLVHLQQLTTPNGFQSFKGFVNPSNTANTMQIRFSGSYEYRYRNIALYTSKFASIDSIPTYTSYNYYKLPSDYFDLVPDGVIFKGNQTEGYPYVKTADYYFEYDELNNKYLAVNYYNKGEYTIEYYRYPVTIDEATLDSEELDNTIDAQELVPYFIAGQVAISDATTQSIGVMILNMYENKLARLSGTEVYGQTEFESNSGW